MGSRTNRAHDARARAREARAAMLQEREAQDARIEDAVAAALLAMEDRTAALAQAEQEERTLASALQRLSQESVTARDIVTMTGLSENYVTRLLRMKLEAIVDAKAGSRWRSTVPLADAPMRVLEEALRDPAVVARYRAKVLEVPGSDCLWWAAAVSGRGHGRFYVGTVGADGRHRR